jgi:arylsulfatase
MDMFTSLAAAAGVPDVSEKESYGHLMQKVSWLMAPMGELMAAHLKTLKDYPPVQGGKSFDMSNVLEQFINNPRQ